VKVKSITGGIEPLSPHGEAWPYVLQVQAVTYYADDLPSLVEIFIPGYTEIKRSSESGMTLVADRQAMSLNTSLIEYASSVQRHLVDMALKQKIISFSQPPNEVQRVLTRSKGLPFDGLLSQDSLDYHWDHVVPLILFVTDYEPYSDRPKPTGQNLIFVDSSNERTFLDSLSILDICRFFVRR
jgi:hypothetical protein